VDCYQNSPPTGIWHETFEVFVVSIVGLACGTLG